MNEYERKQEERRQRYLDRATDAQRESASLYGAYRRSADVIPLGQPILVGHHSEKRHRRHLERLDNMMRRSVEADEKARHYAGKAASVGTSGISSDDPDALTKLRAELDQCEQVQARMKTANKLIRSFREQLAEGRTDGYLLAMEAEGFTREKAVRLLEPDFCGRIGFPDYALTNNGANMRRIKQRIATLEQTRTAADVTEEGAGYTYREDVTENRVCFEFPGKPSEEVRTLLKSHGFKWSPTRGAWVRFLNGAGRAAGQVVKTKLSALYPQTP